MSDIRSLEPQAHGLIIFKTTFGDLELELFTQQCPKNTRNFTQLCLDGYYEGTIFDRIEKDFIAIGGKEPEEGQDHSAIEFDIAPDEFHSRLKFSRRGLLATANTEKNKNGPAFFFSLGPAPELQNKHTIFGRLKGDTVYYLVDLNDCPVDDDKAPISEKKIMEVVVVDNPYPDLKRRPSFAKAICQSRLRQEHERHSSEEDDRDYLEPKFDIKNAKKLSFYNDDSEDEESSDSGNDTNAKPETEFKVPESPKPQDDGEPSRSHQTTANNTDEIESKLSEDARKKRLLEIKEQMRKFKQELELQSATKIRTLSERKRSSEGSQHNTTLESRADSSKQSSIEDRDVSTQEVRLATKKGRQRERETLELMERFKKKLKATTMSAASTTSTERNDGGSGSPDPKHLYESDDDKGQHLSDELALVDGDDWLRHRFDAESSGEVSAKDANTKGDDWYSIDDPRHPTLNMRETERARDNKSHSRRRDKDYDERDEGYRSRHRHRRDGHKSHKHHRSTSSSSHHSKSRTHRRD